MRELGGQSRGQRGPRLSPEGPPHPGHTQGPEPCSGKADGEPVNHSERLGTYSLLRGTLRAPIPPLDRAVCADWRQWLSPGRAGCELGRGLLSRRLLTGIGRRPFDTGRALSWHETRGQGPGPTCWLRESNLPLPTQCGLPGGASASVGAGVGGVGRGGGAWPQPLLLETGPGLPHSPALPCSPASPIPCPPPNPVPPILSHPREPCSAGRE